MKLLLYVVVDDNDLEGTYRSVWIDENEIIGFYMADTTHDGIKSVNLFLNGHCINVVQNDRLIEFLNKRFKVNDKVKA